jgi:hypothetical protein
MFLIENNVSTADEQRCPWRRCRCRRRCRTAAAVAVASRQQQRQIF